MAPFALVDDLGKAGAYMVYLLIGIAFGATLEVAGFANSRKLAAQFYLTDLTVLKVMFTGIITAMVLIFLASAMGLLNYNSIYVNPTYLWPGIVGGRSLLLPRTHDRRLRLWRDSWVHKRLLVFLIHGPLHPARVARYLHRCRGTTCCADGDRCVLDGSQSGGGLR